MASINEATIMGSLGRDPEVRRTQDGGKIVTLNIATSENWKDKQTGEKKEKTEWHRVIIFGDGLAGIAEKYLHKGDPVYIRGKLQTRKWEKDGHTNYTTEIVLQGPEAKLKLLASRRNNDDRNDGEERSGGQQQSRQQEQPRQNSGGGGWDSGKSSGLSEDLDDEIPFDLAA